MPRAWKVTAVTGKPSPSRAYQTVYCPASRDYSLLVLLHVHVCCFSQQTRPLADADGSQSITLHNIYRTEAFVHTKEDTTQKLQE